MKRQINTMNGLPEIQYSKSIMTGSGKEKKLLKRVGADSIAAYKPGSRKDLASLRSLTR